MSSLILGLLTIGLVSATPPTSPEAPPGASTQLTVPSSTPGPVPLPGAQDPALEPDPGSEAEGAAEGDGSAGACGADLVVSGASEPAGARARAVNLKFVTFVHILRGQARATPTAGTRAPPLT